MAMLPYVEDDNASTEVKVLFEHCEVLMGRVANAVRMAAHSPKVTQPLIGFMVAALRHEITGVLAMRIKALVILKTSTLNACSYCIGHNTALGKSLGFEDDEIDAISGDYQNSDYFSVAEKAAISWAEVLTEKTYNQRKDAKEELKKHFSPEQIIEITMVSGFFNFWNRFTDSLEIDLETSDSVGNIRKSKVVDPQAYKNYLRDCWWNEKYDEA
jgi:uncharacterized peroxidase-related enzyme